MPSKASRLSGLAKELDALAAASSSTLVVYEYTATAGQTVFSGPDNNGLTLNYIGPNTLVVYNEGVLQKTVDYTTTSASVLTLTLGAEAGALVRMYAFGTFAVANVYTKTEDDARFVNKADVIDIAHGGTGASTLATAKTALGITPLETLLASRTWQGATRTVGSTYTNNTGHDIVICAVFGPAAGLNTLVAFYVNTGAGEVNVVSIYAGAAGHYISFQNLVVPAGATYRFATPNGAISVTSWTELR